MNIIRFYRGVYSDNRLRRERRRSLARDLGLYWRNRLLQPLEWALLSRYPPSGQTIVFIVGSPRSGTTLLYQLMARFLDVGYVSNEIARYWLAPLYASIRRQERLATERRVIDFSSSLGSAVGSSAPHEFTYFWHFWSGFFSHDDLTEDELGRIDWSSIRRELGGLASWWRGPLVLKALTHVNYSIPRVLHQLPEARFLAIGREEEFVVQSILKAREQRYGSEEHWWSLRPRDFKEWLGRSPVEQVAHQVRDVERGVRAGLEAVPRQARLLTTYEDLVRKPHRELERIADFCGAQLVSASRLAGLELKNKNEWRVGPRRRAEIEQCLTAMS